MIKIKDSAFTRENFEMAMQHLADANALLGDSNRIHGVNPDIFYKDRLSFLSEMSDAVSCRVHDAEENRRKFYGV